MTLINMSVGKAFKPPKNVSRIRFVETMSSEELSVFA